MCFFTFLYSKLKKIYRNLLKIGDVLERYHQDQLNRFLQNEEYIRFRTILNQYEFSELINQESGIQQTLHSGEELIISLTSYGYRIHDLHYVVESLLTQTLKPNRIILWLSKDEFSDDLLPQSLKNKLKRGLEIRYCSDLMSYKKLLPTLKEFPNSIIVTADDDVLYPHDWLERMYRCHINHPDDIICTNAHIISFDDNGQILPYAKWNNPPQYRETASIALLPVGIGGVLYPPRTLDQDIFNTELFKRLTPTADDLWFKVMSLRRGTICRVIQINEGFYNYITPFIRVSDTPLFDINCKTNDIQIKNIFSFYNICSDNFDEQRKIDERIVPSFYYENVEDYILYLKHRFAYEYILPYINQGTKILDLGCGEGYGTYMLASKAKAFFYALDVDEKTIIEAKQKYNGDNIEFKCYDGGSNAFPDNTFDMIISFQVIEHVSNPEIFLKEICRMLKPNGKFFITTPQRTYRLADKQIPWNKYHITEYDYISLSLLAKNVYEKFYIYSITAIPEVSLIEKERVRCSRSDYDGVPSAIWKPNNFLQLYDTSCFHVTNKNIDDGLDLLLTNMELKL